MNPSHFGNIWKVALLAALAAPLLAPGQAAAKGEICPQFEGRYCIENYDGRHLTVMTNPCFARQEHLRILHAGSCNKE
jgi:hypothetical protein